MQRIDTKLTWEFKRFVNIKSDCVVPENIHTPPPLTTKGNGNSEAGEGGGGVQKQAVSEIMRVASRVFFVGASSESKRLVILLLIGVSKQELMIFYLRSAECFFHSLHSTLYNTIVVGS